MARILFLMMLAGLSSCKQKTRSSAQGSVYYTCSMDPQVRESKPGRCPICHMELTPVQAAGSHQFNEIMLSEQQIYLGNIHVDTIRNGMIRDRLILTGTVNFDQMKSGSVTARVEGRIEKLFFKSVGDRIEKGMPLYEIYSENLNNAKQEYLQLLHRKNRNGSDASIEQDPLIRAAKNKLLLWGMHEQQIQEMAEQQKADSRTLMYSNTSGYITSLEIREGDYIMEGGAIVKLSDLSSVWVEAQVYASQLASMHRNSKVSVQFPELNGTEVEGHLDFVNPEINPDTRINLIRVVIPNPSNRYKPGMPAYVMLESPGQRHLSLPSDALIRDEKGASVWIMPQKNLFRSVRVQTGLEVDNSIEILSGLKEGDPVVISGAYLLNSEFIFRKGADPQQDQKSNLYPMTGVIPSR